jgi:hypothetical protein
MPGLHVHCLTEFDLVQLSNHLAGLNSDSETGKDHLSTDPEWQWLREHCHLRDSQMNRGGNLRVLLAMHRTDVTADICDRVQCSLAVLEPSRRVSVLMIADVGDDSVGWERVLAEWLARLAKQHAKMIKGAVDVVPELRGGSGAGQEVGDPVWKTIRTLPGVGETRATQLQQHFGGRSCLFHAMAATDHGGGVCRFAIAVHGRCG